MGPWEAAQSGGTSSLQIRNSRFIDSPISSWGCSSSNYFYVYDSYFCGTPIGVAESCVNADQGGNIFSDNCDCDGSGVLDLSEIQDGLLLDCDENFVPDVCQIEAGTGFDCNQNTILDACDIESGLSLDIDLDGTPDECQCRADLNQDLEVAASDLGLLIAAWNTDGSIVEGSDINGDGTVNAADLGLLIGAWGPCQ